VRLDGCELTLPPLEFSYLRALAERGPDFSLPLVQGGAAARARGGRRRVLLDGGDVAAKAAAPLQGGRLGVAPAGMLGSQRVA
jgi:hypothetical protein